MLMLVMMMAQAHDAFVVARTLTAAETRCETSANATDITVCGLRRADRYRVPFTGYEAGDRRAQNVRLERDALLARTNPVREMSPFLVGGGMSGVTVSSHGSGPVTVRKPAP